MKKKLSLLLCLAMTLFVMTSSTKITTIFVIGDSTAAEKSNFKDNPCLLYTSPSPRDRG